MRSPITNGQAILCYEEREVEFRREKFTITEFFYKCQDTGEEFMTGELMEVSLKQVYDQYNAKHGLGTITYKQLALQHHN
jgi:hypothetical protein